ncbi:MAG: hypothetical protein U9O82_02330 [Thermodesulfobacteriota bacterium]|nr:hypothetical protein [Thermodesulfobacteriota bacterium]
MMNLAELKADRELVNAIDWHMTPEKAVKMFLEWGTGWYEYKNYNWINSHNDESIYFVLFDWEETHQATLIDRTMKGAEEIARVPVPEDLFFEACKEDGYLPGVGVHPLNRSLKEWIRKEIDGPPLDFGYEN